MKAILNFLSRNNISPDELYSLLCYKYKSTIEFIDNELITETLKVKGYLTEKYKLSKKATSLLSELNNLSGTQKETSGKYTQKEIEDQLDTYLDIFPKHKLPSGKYARSDKKALLKSFIWFFKNYDYTWEQVFAATKRYVDEYSRQNYKYMRTSFYFVKKTDSNKVVYSELADYCRVSDYGDEPVYFTDRVI